jgi:hypothetical protein
MVVWIEGAAMTTFNLGDTGSRDVGAVVAVGVGLLVAWGAAVVWGVEVLSSPQARIRAEHSIRKIRRAREPFGTFKTAAKGFTDSSLANMLQVDGRAHRLIVAEGPFPQGPS